MKLTRQPYPSAKSTMNRADLANAYQDVGNVVNGQLEFGSPLVTGDPTTGNQNMNGFWYAGVSPATPDTEFTVTHNLGRVPTGVLTFSIDQAGIVYRSSTTWTTTDAYLKCNVASASIIVFVT